jgi:hypothetical protein
VGLQRNGVMPAGEAATSRLVLVPSW